MLAVQLCCARHCELPLSKMGNKGLFPGVAVPLAFFCTLFFRHRKKSVSAPWDGQSQSAPESARQAPTGESLCGASRGLSSGQTIGAVRTAVRPACCLPELRVANRLRRLYPLDTRFPSFPPCTPFGSPSEAIERPIGLQVLPPRRNRRVKPHRGAGNAPAGAPKGFPRGKQSTRPALPCVPLVVCLNSGSLTAFGGCIHWMTVNFSNLI